jgi:two-component system cell cycle response regulator
MAQGVTFALLLAFALHAALWHGDHLDGFFNDWVYNGLVVAAAGFCLVRAARYRVDRLPWLLLGLALSLWAGAEITSTAYLAKLDDPPYPSIADALWLGFYPVTYLALVLHVRGRMRGARRASVWLDGLIAALAVAAVVEVIVFRPVVQQTGGTPLEVATDLAYPLCDLLLLSLVVGVFAMCGWRPGRAWALIGLGLVAAVVADSIYAYQAAKGTYVEGTILDALWPAATLLVGYAAWERAGRTIEARPTGVRVLVLPVFFASTSLALLVYDHFHQVDTIALGLATATLVAVLWRTALTFRENLRMLEYSRREAMTDALTGLGNRRKLMIDLMSEIELATAKTQRALILYDLDGFKRYNDSYGHPAGDALLARLGRNLAVAVSAWGRAYRLGGDEFCALVEIDESQADDLLRETRTALTEAGEGFLVTASHGMVFLPIEASDPALAMQIADQRLYGSKGTRRRNAVTTQTRDVLLQVLHERRPELHERMHEVAELALVVGRKMALLPEELDEMARAAELHDVGKMAIPDEILNKPGPLDRIEQGLIHQHTIVGERILAAAPSLSPVARIVRASHERWDGSGYPDGLKGDQIPLASRIIAACDAYHAMTSDRPYQDAVPQRAALAELRRCAGGHFDPRVVDVLCKEIEGGATAELPSVGARVTDELDALDAHVTAELPAVDPDAPDLTPLDATLDADLARRLAAERERD